MLNRHQNLGFYGNRRRIQKKHEEKKQQQVQYPQNILVSHHPANVNVVGNSSAFWRESIPSLIVDALLDAIQQEDDETFCKALNKISSEILLENKEKIQRKLSGRLVELQQREEEAKNQFSRIQLILENKLKLHPSEFEKYTKKIADNTSKLESAMEDLASLRNKLNNMQQAFDEHFNASHTRRCQIL